TNELELGENGFDLAPLRKLSPKITDAEWARISAVKSAELVELRWKPTDTAALPAAYAAVEKLCGEGTWTVDAQTENLLDAKGWAGLASDAAPWPPRADHHFVNQLFPEDDGSLTIETAGT